MKNNFNVKILDDIKAFCKKKKWGVNVSYWSQDQVDDLMICIDVYSESATYFKQYHKMSHKLYPTHLDKLNKLNWWLIEHFIKELNYNKEFIKKIAFFYEMSDKDCMNLNIPNCNFDEITFDGQTFTNCLTYYI